MAITHRTYVILVFPLCCASIALLITSLATRNWYESDAIYNDTTSLVSYINYGLFSGTFEDNKLATTRFYNLYMTCLPDVAICGLSCMSNETSRELQIRELYENGTNSFTCETARSAIDIKLLNNKQKNFTPSEEFISLGLWASTISFLSVAMLFATLGAIFSVVNSASNPVEPLLGIFGLYAWNSCAVIAIVITMIVWGIQYAVTLVDTAVTPETITGNISSKGMSNLGYSYWLLIPCAIFHIIAIILLLYRRHLIKTTPPAPTINMEEDPDGIIFLY